MTRIATILALLLLSGCSTTGFSQPGRVPSYRQPFVTAPASATYEPPAACRRDRSRPRLRSELVLSQREKETARRFSLYHQLQEATLTTTAPTRAQPLLGRVALVTGAQQGIGRAIAIEFAAAGADVAINYLDDQAAAEAVAEEVTRLGRRSLLVQGNVADVAQAGAMAAATRQLGKLHVLVANAGIYPRVPMLAMQEADWDAVLDVNLKGTFFCSQAAARIMVEDGTPGAIISLASRAIGGSVRGVHYSASKGGIVSLTRAMALELAPHRIRVNAIAPGLTDTAQPRHGMSEAEIAEASEALPLGRMAMPADIAQTAVFLASEASALMTGQVLHVNSGSYMP